MSLSRRRFTQEFKLSAVERLEQGASAAEVSRAFEINPNLLHRWRREFRQGPGNAFPGEGKRRWEETQTAQLERKVGRQAMEIDFLKGCLQRIEQQRKLRASTGKPLSTTKSATSPGETAADGPTDVSAGTAARARASTAGSLTSKGPRSGPGTARHDPAHRPGVPQLRTAAHHRRVAPARPGDQSQEGLSHPARRQSAVPARQTADEKILSFVHQLDSDFLEGTIDYTNNLGEAYEDPAPLAIAHMFNHQTHHRAQVQAMLGELGKPPNLDLHRAVLPGSGKPSA